MSQLQIFKYEDESRLNELTTVEINGEVWFVAADVCALLEITNVTQAVSSLEEDEKLPYVLHRAGQTRRVNLVNESGLYALIFKSKKSSAKRFRQWVTKEVLPAIRKQGGYSIVQTTPPSPISVYTMRILSEPIKEKPRGYFTVFEKSHSILLLIETKIGCQNKFDLADGSIAKRWIAHREGQFWAMPAGRCFYEFDDGRPKVEIYCYHGSESQYFEDWLEYTYKTQYLLPYLLTKYRTEKNQFMLERVKKILPLLLKRAS